MSAARISKDPERRPDEKAAEQEPSARGLDDLARLQKNYSGRESDSPARKMQSELVGKFQAAERPAGGISLRATLGTLAVLCLSLSAAALYLAKFA